MKQTNLIRINRITYILLYCASFLINSLNAQVLSPEKIYEKVSPSIMTLEVSKEDGNTTIGTAYLIKKDDVAVTCFHVIEGAKSVKARFSNGEEFEVSGIIDKDVKRDIALIRVKSFRNNFLALVPEEPKVGQASFVIGAPEGLEFSISDGIISQIQTIGGMKQYQFTCPVSPGNSGSPLIDTQGKSIGIVTWQIKEGQNLNFAIPSKYILGLDYSLSTKPWESIGKEPDLISEISSEQRFDSLIAKHLTNFVDLTMALSYVFTVNISQENGYKLPLFPKYFTTIMNVKLTLKELESITVSDNRKMTIKESIILDTKNLLSSADLQKKSIEYARKNEGWNYHAQEILNQAMAFVQTSRIEEGDMHYMSKFEDFVQESQDGVRAFFDGREKSLGYALGCISFTDDPLLWVKVVPKSYAEEFGIQDGDKILFVDKLIVKDIYEIKKIIYEKRGNTIEIELLRNNKKEVIDIEIPHELKFMH